ncbi:molybdopterin-binding protein [Danaus plexippus plexippus]|uniref:FAD synthase n=1 Tax=Danaus plexippus plexippus TaxID=278856 RepID=A0A212ES28_DANPL|nr:probable FAD synthase [Danaus plexippus plexippus]OWR44285.1 molybdopterin-binding protein [Danaus plexippus plexippus]
MDIQNVETVIEESKQVLEECFNLFQLEEVFLCFNGGKDCTVLLDLTISVLKTKFKTNDVAKDLKVVYIQTKGPFIEIEEFVKEIELYYGIEIVVMGGELKTTLQRILESDKRIRAGLMGTRRTDPHSEKLVFMQKTDPNWPQMMRVSPLLNWNYHQIWNYILQRKVPYCKLYDRGYTSIGSIYNTLPNKSLAFTDDGRTMYHPAWMLADAGLERAGRGPTNGHINNTENQIDHL